MSIIVIETHEDTGVEWGISFNGYNPEPPDYFKMVDQETAFRIMEYLNNLTVNSPVS